MLNKYGWPVLAFVAAGALFIGLFFGSITVTGVDPAQAPHGAIEYVMHRYQTLIAGGLALFGGLVVFWQLRESRKQHRANLRNAHRKEIQTITAAQGYAIHTISLCKITDLDPGNAPGKFTLKRNFFPAPEPLHSNIQSHCDNIVVMYYNELIREMDSFMEWQDGGSIVEKDLWEGETPDFFYRIRKIDGAAVEFMDTLNSSLKQIDEYITG